jgi:hypothetical protein
MTLSFASGMYRADDVRLRQHWQHERRQFLRRVGIVQLFRFLSFFWIVQLVR